MQTSRKGVRSLLQGTEARDPLRLPVASPFLNLGIEAAHRYFATIGGKILSVSYTCCRDAGTSQDPQEQLHPLQASDMAVDVSAVPYLCESLLRGYWILLQRDFVQCSVSHSKHNL